MNILNDLVESLHRNTFTLFIGADLPCDVTGLPSRADLARELARHKGLDESLSLADVAQRVSQAGNRWEFTAFIRDALDTAGKSPQPFHQRIVALVQERQIETLITTAYDNLLELTFQEADLGINRVVRGSDVHFINPVRPTLIKLYGDAQQPDTLVVTDRDHSDLLRDREREPLVDEVRRAFRRNTVLFLGYNLSDPDFRFLFDQIAESRFARLAYAVWPGLPQTDVRMWRDRGIAIMDADPLGVLTELPAKPRPMGSQVLPPSDHAIESLKSSVASGGPSQVFSPIADHLVYDFVEHFPEATVVKQMDDPQIRVQILDPCVCGGESKRAIFAHPHPLHGCKFKYTIRDLPAMIRCVRLVFFIGICDKSNFAASDSIHFEIHINGEMIWSKQWSKKQWNRNQIAGIEVDPKRALEVMFVTDDLGHNVYNWAVWGSPVLVVEELRKDEISGICQANDHASQSTVSPIGEKDMNYERGLDAFKQLAEGTDWYQDFTVHEALLRENLRDERRYGPSEQTRRDRTRIVDQLNALALAHLGISFNDLCMGELPSLRHLDRAAGGDVTVIDLNKLRAEIKERWGKKPAKGDGEASPETIYGAGNRWAVLVGVNEYEDRATYGRLHVCVKDVHAIREQLVAGGFDPARIRLLTDETAELPTRDNILIALKAVADATEPDDLLLFYYSGHGDEDGGESYLVARNGRRLVLRDTAVRLSRIREMMEDAPARAKIIVLDACHSGADIGGKGPLPMSEGFIHRVFEQAEGMAILASCKQGQLSYEWRENECSVFTHFLLEALAGAADRDEKGFVTVQDASRHVTDGVKLWASQRNMSQIPTLQYTVAGDIILVRYQ